MPFLFLCSPRMNSFFIIFCSENQYFDSLRFEIRMNIGLGPEFPISLNFSSLFVEVRSSEFFRAADIVVENITMLS